MNRAVRNTEQSQQVTQFLGWTPWEWFATLTLPDTATMGNLEWCLKKWRRELFNVAKGKIAYEGVFVHEPNKHVHLLIMSQPNKHGQTLADLDQSAVTELKKRWFALAGRPADIRPVSSSEGIAAYMSCRKNIGSRPWETIDPCGIDLLKQLRS